MLSDWELWACADHVHRRHGDQAPMFVAEQIGALVLSGEAGGIAAWQAIAHRIVELRSSERVQ